LLSHWIPQNINTEISRTVILPVVLVSLYERPFLVCRIKRRTEAENWLLRKIFGSKREEVKGDKHYIIWSFMI
jgi:hypothetical protein